MTDEQKKQYHEIVDENILKDGYQIRAYQASDFIKICN